MTKPLVQCGSCPWRVDCVPDKDIPNYQCKLHEGLSDTIQSGERSLSSWLMGELRVMACHYSKSDDEFPCAGWLHNQIGDGNNIAVRLAVITGRFPPPEVDGPQHETFLDTLPTVKAKRRATRKPRKVRR